MTIVHDSTTCLLREGEVRMSNERLLWAKASPSYKSLWHHMIDSGFCAARLAEDPRFLCATHLIATHFGLENQEAIRLIAYLASMHDCYGKAHPAFQKKSVQDAAAFAESGIISVLDREHGYRHERYGAHLFEKKAMELFDVNPLVAKVLASAIELHHQGKTGHANPPKRAKEQWTIMGDELHRMAVMLFQPPLDQLDHCNHCDACVVVLSSFVILADWIASSDPFESLNEEDDSHYFALSRTIADHAVKEYGLSSDHDFPLIQEYETLWPFLSKDRLRSLQSAMVSDVWPDADLTILEAPMGEGKTEAGAYYAARLCGMQGRHGIYFALPTAATSNQMYRRMEAMFTQIHRKGPRLMHGMAWLALLNAVSFMKDEEESPERNDWLQPMRRAMLAENGVGTVDQAMMAALQIRYGCLRLLGLVGKVLVIDEVHAYDAYMYSILEKLLQWCKALRIPVVMLSATLTQEKRIALMKAVGATECKAEQAYPLITQVRGGEVRQVVVSGTAKSGAYTFKPLCIWNNPQQLADLALCKVAAGGCLCVMMNTVDEAQRVYQAIAERESDVQVLLFHARMMAMHRNAVESQCMEWFGKDTEKRPSKAILVCTQVVEQSMDLDFDGMITCIAPVDLLLQRAGRVHRHMRANRPEKMAFPLIEVLVPQDIREDAYGVNGAVYAPWLLMQTHRQLPCCVTIPEGIRSCIERVYEHPAGAEEAWLSMAFQNSLMAAQAKSCELPPPNAERFFGWDQADSVFNYEEKDERIAAKTRLSSQTLRVALLEEAQVEGAENARVPLSVAQDVLLHSFTIRAKLEDEEKIRTGNGALRDVILICKDRLPVCLGNVILDYDDVLGAIVRRREEA